LHGTILEDDKRYQDVSQCSHDKDEAVETRADDLQSISPTFYELLLIASIFFCQILQSQSVGKEKLCKTILYKKAACKMWVKLKPPVNITQRIQAVLHQYYFVKQLQ